MIVNGVGRPADQALQTPKKLASPKHKVSDFVNFHLQAIKVKKYCSNICKLFFFSFLKGIT